MDSGAPRSCIRRSQYRRVLAALNRRSLPVIASSLTPHFGDHTVKSLRVVEVTLQTPEHVQPIPVLLNIVPIEAPALLGLYALDIYGIVAGNVSNRLQHCIVLSEDSLRARDIWSIPLRLISTHLYARMHHPSYTYYSTLHLENLHMKFSHPSSAELYSLLMTAGKKHNHTLDA